MAVAAAVVFAVSTADAKIGAAYQMLLGNPSSATTDAANTTNYLMVRDQFALSYNDTLGQPNWVSWHLTTADVGSSGRSPSFFEDPDLPAGFYRVKPTDYGDTGIDRGHMCPSGDRTVSRADNDIVFYMSNMIPQASWNNQGVWNTFEQYCRNLAAAGNEVLITCGPSTFSGSRISSGKAAIPGYTWKIVVVVPNGTTPTLERINTSTRVIAIKVPNNLGGTLVSAADEWKKYLVSVNQLQQDTGFTFFTALPAQTASVLRTMIDGQAVVGAPVIDTAPVGQSVAAGGSVTLSVAASGNAPLTYQWSFEGQAINGANSASLALTNVGLAQMGSYTVTVSNSLGTVTSDPALVVVTGVAPSVLTPPASQTVNAGANVTFSVLASGSPTMTYQWRKDSQAINNATAASYSLTNVQDNAAGTYDVVVTNSVSSTTSAAATLTVNAVAPVIVTAPVAQAVGINGTASFTVVASGTQPITYQWRKDGQPLVDNATATSATLILANVSEASVGDYDVVLQNSIGSVTSTPVALTLSSFTNGALNYTGGTYSQDFNSLLSVQGTDLILTGAGPHGLEAAPLNGSNAQGWSVAKYGGSGSNALFKVDDGSLFANGAAYSYGASGSADRALGSLSSGTTQSRFGLALTNNSGRTITQFTVTYTGEQWRDGTGVQNTLNFSYGIGVADISATGFTDVPALNFTSPVSASVNTNGLALDGNATGNRTTITATVSGIAWPAGSRLVLRWTDPDELNGDDGQAIDDFSFTAPTDSGPVAPAVVTTTPANSATGYAVGSPVVVTFNQPVTVADGWFSLSSTGSGALTATASGGPSIYTLTPTTALPYSDTINVTLVGAKVTDQFSGSLTMAADYTFSFTTADPIAPSITTQPVSRTVLAGTNTTFSVVAAGTQPLSYQWRKDGQPINGATSASLALTNVQPANAGAYDVVVTNFVSSVTSNVATLSVSSISGNAITWNFSTATPSSTLPTGITGGTVTQGNNNGTTTLLTTTSASNFSGASGTNNAGLAARVGALNQATNGSAYFEFTFTPQSDARLLATGVSFGSRSTGTGPQAYALYSSVDNYTAPLASGTLLNNSTWALQTPTTFTTATGTVGLPITFRLYGYNGAGTPSAGTANWRIDDLTLVLALQIAPSIVTSPTSQTAIRGQSASFSVVAAGSEALSYQWRRNGTPISTNNASATTATLTLSNLTVDDAGSYDVVVTNDAGTVTSAAATLTVQSAGFDGWAADNFNSAELEDPFVSGSQARLTGDGLTNLFKYALGYGPRATVSRVGDISSTTEQITFSYDRPVDRPDITYTVEASTDLVTWSSAGVTHERVSSNTTTESWRGVYPLSSNSPRVFLRLKVEKP